MVETRIHGTEWSYQLRKEALEEKLNELKMNPKEFAIRTGKPEK
jgi:hypothetical protein